MMRTLRQMLRQPLKSAAGLVLMTLAAAILCVCMGQAFAAQKMADVLEHRFTTVALPAGLQKVDGMVIQPSVTLSEDLRQWLEETAAEHHDVVKGIMRQGVASAWLPGLSPLNHTQGKYIATGFTSGNFTFHFFEPSPSGTPYACAMLTVTLEEISGAEAIPQRFTVEADKSIGDFATYADYLAYCAGVQEESVTVGYTVRLSGTVTGVVSLQEGFRDPTGMTARLTMTVPDLAQLDALHLTPGQQVLVYGMDYADEDWAFRGLLANENQSQPVKIDAFNLSRLSILTEDELAAYSGYRADKMPYARYGDLLLTKTEYERVNAISLTLALPVSQLEYEAVRDESGHLLSVQEVETVSCPALNGEVLTVSREEYSQRYAVPTIAVLDGSVEDFLRSDEGTLWRTALARDEVNQSAFAVICVDKLGYMADFARQDAQIVAGRDFTEAECIGGERVCILHEALAAANGLSVGDTITAHFYQRDAALPYQEVGKLNPAASLYFDTTLSDAAAYTIVGLYRTGELWCDVSENEYGFSPNTVFVPKASVGVALEYRDSVLFTTPVIVNGQLDAFRELAAKAGYLDRFVYHDQGYAVIAGSFSDYAALARQAAGAGTAVYAVILLLFLLLYPHAQRRTAAMMEALGAPVGQRFAHVLLSAVILLVPAALLGGAMGVLLWQTAVRAMKAHVETAVSLQMDVGTLALIALAQLAFAAVMSACVSVRAAASKGLASRRAK